MIVNIHNTAFPRTCRLRRPLTLLQLFIHLWVAKEMTDLELSYEEACKKYPGSIQNLKYKGTKFCYSTSSALVLGRGSFGIVHKGWHNVSANINSPPCVHNNCTCSVVQSRCLISPLLQSLISQTCFCRGKYSLLSNDQVSRWTSTSITKNKQTWVQWMLMWWNLPAVHCFSLSVVMHCYSYSV